MNTLSEYRSMIDTIDNSIMVLLNERMRIAKKIGEIKKKNNQSIYVPERSEMLLKKLIDQNNGPITHDSIKYIYREIIASALSLEERTNISCYGLESEMAQCLIREIFGSSLHFSFDQSLPHFLDNLLDKKFDAGVLVLEHTDTIPYPIFKISPIIAEREEPINEDKSWYLFELLNQKKLFCSLRVNVKNQHQSKNYLIIRTEHNQSSSLDCTLISIPFKNTESKSSFLLYLNDCQKNLIRNIYHLPIMENHFILEVDGYFSDGNVQLFLQNLGSMGIYPNSWGSYPISFFSFV